MRHKRIKCSPSFENIETIGNWLGVYCIWPIHDLPSRLHECLLVLSISSLESVEGIQENYEVHQWHYQFLHSIHTLGASQFVGFTDSNWDSLVDDRMSTSSFSYHLEFAPIA